MRTPFPGMDPYLEHENYWSGLHGTLIAEMQRALNAALPEKYVARTEQRCWIEPTDKYIVPDVSVHIVSEGAPPYGAIRRPRAGQPKKLKSLDAPIKISATEDAHKERFLQIVDVRDTSKVIVEIELLSHSNKRLRDVGRELYQEKQRNVLHSRTHFIEIDLLRSGEHTVACPKTFLNKHGRWDYLVCLHPACTECEFFVWLKTVRDSLPTIQIPLEKQGEEVELDLQAALNESYKAGAFFKLLKYNAPPVPPLSPEDTDWAAELLKKVRK